MATKMIKFRSFFYYVERPALGVPDQNLLAEKMGFFGEEHDIPREEDLARGEELGAFFTDDEVEQIKAGKYTGPEAELLGQEPMSVALTEEEAATQRQAMPQNAGDGAPAVGIDVREEDAETIALYIKSQKLTVAETVALAEGDAELAEKVLDAEGMATNSDPRKGVVEALEAIPTGGN